MFNSNPRSINKINIFNINDTIDYNIWNLAKLEICKLYNNNSNNIKVTLNKNDEITSTQNLNNDVKIVFYDYYIKSDNVESVNFINYILKNNVLFYNFEFLNDFNNSQNELDFFNNVIKTINKNKKIILIDDLLT